MNPQENEKTWQEWLQENWPNMRALDHNWTMERYDYPQYVRDGIAENWIKVNDENGGTWHEPNYHKKKLDESAESAASADASADNGKSFATAYKDTGLSERMDDANKKALDVMQNEGMNAAIKHMFTDQESGRQLSYGEMRMRYG